MTPEEEWLDASLKRNREARMFRDMLEPDERVPVWSMHAKSNRYAWIWRVYALAVFLALALVVAYYS